MLQWSLPESKECKVEGTIAWFLAAWLVEGQEEAWASHSTL